jgi:hypothetical protein
MEFIPLTEIGDRQWNQFCDESDDAWFLHTTAWRNYTLELDSGRFQTLCCSFGVAENGQILAICPLILETRISKEVTISEFSYTGEPCPFPAISNSASPEKRGKLLDAIFKRVDELASEYGVVRSSLRCNVLSEKLGLGNDNGFNYIVRYGYLESNLFSQVIDLGLDTDKLMKGMRKGHRYDVKKSLRNFSFSIYDHSNIQDSVFNSYRDMHSKAAGRVTRVSTTFDMMREWIRAGKAILCGAAQNNIPVGFALAFVYKKGSLYASACNDPDYHHFPIGHGIQWSLMNTLKDRGIRSYDVGLQFWGYQLHTSPTEKGIAISRFKRGFGGVSLPVFAGEKYFDREFFEAVYRDRVSKLVQSIGNPEKDDF